MKPDTKWNQLRGDGGTQPMPPDQLTKLKQGFEQMCKDAGNEVNDRRAAADDIRKCVWPGQSPDGRKHRDAMDGREPFPYEGASDKRERTADAITNEQVMVIMAALMRFNLGFAGLPGATKLESDELAEKLSHLWEHVERNQLAAEWFTEWTRFAQWRQGDSPAVGVMQVYWHQERALKPVTLSEPEFRAKIAELAVKQGLQPTQEDMLDLEEMLAVTERAPDLAELLQVLYEDMPPSTAAKAAQQLQEEGECAFPYPYVCENRLRMKARRLFKDVFVPENTEPTEMQRARRIDVLEWFDETELREMESGGAFDTRGFVDEVLKHPGKSPFKYFSHRAGDGTWSSSPQERTWDESRQKERYALVTTFYRATNKEGIPGTYTIVWHHAVEQAGTKQRLVDYQIGSRRYPFIFSVRELWADTLWESRGNCELSATEQQSLKTLHDMFMDNAQLATVPPIEVPASRPKLALGWGPLRMIKVNRPGEIRLLTPPQYPAATDKMIAIVKDGLARYFGQIADGNPADLVRLYQQSLVDFMFIPVAEVMTVGTMLAVQFMEDEQLASIVGPDAVAQVREIATAGRFHAEIDFEAGMLSMDYMKQIGEMISNYVLKWDTQSTIPRDVLVKWFLGQLSRRLANRLTRPVADANQSEIADEEKNFSLIASGVEPPMMEAGQNWALRRQTLLDIGRKNPEAYAKLTPTSWQILTARLQHFDGQLTQEKNAIIGRTMASPALPEADPLNPGAAATAA